MWRGGGAHRLLLATQIKHRSILTFDLIKYYNGQIKHSAYLEFSLQIFNNKQIALIMLQACSNLLATRFIPTLYVTLR